MNPETRLFINGQLVPAASGRTYPNINPATEEVLGNVADAGPEDMERAIAAARRAFDTTDWSTNHAFRLRCLTQLRDALRALGLTRVHGNDGTDAWCTVASASRFFSHRRDRVSGRLAACVWLG